MRTRDTQSHDFNELEQGKTTKKSTDNPKKNRYKKSDALKALEQLAFENLKAKFPSFPFPPKPKYNDNTTNRLTKCVIDYIILKGFQAERVGSTGFLKDNRKNSTDVLGRNRTIGNIKWIPGRGKTEKVNVHAVINGIAFKIYIKCAASRDSKKSEGQFAYPKEINAADGLYLIVTCFQGFYEWFNNASL